MEHPAGSLLNSALSWLFCPSGAVLIFGRHVLAQERDTLWLGTEEGAG